MFGTCMHMHTCVCNVYACVCHIVCMGICRYVVLCIACMCDVCACMLCTHIESVICRYIIYGCMHCLRVCVCMFVECVESGCARLKLSSNYTLGIGITALHPLSLIASQKPSKVDLYPFIDGKTAVPLGLWIRDLIHLVSRTIKFPQDLK